MTTSATAQAEQAEDAPLGSRAFDNLYQLAADRRLTVSGEDRRVTVALGDGYRWAQVFAPADADFVCLEPMTAPVNALVTGDHLLVPAGETFTAGFSVHVEEVR